MTQSLYGIGRSKNNTVKITKIGTTDSGDDCFEVAYCSDGGLYHHRGFLEHITDWLANIMFVGGGTINQMKSKLKHLSGDDVLAVAVKG
jgi:hypothetical protein